MGSTVKIRYLGSKFPKIVELPIPFHAKSEKTGSVTFQNEDGREQDMPSTDASNLVNLGGLFERVEGEKERTPAIEKEVQPAPEGSENDFQEENDQEDEEKAELDNDDTNVAEETVIPSVTDEGIARELLEGEGLNHSSFTRAIKGTVEINQTDKEETRGAYNAILNQLESKIYKQGHDYFWKKEN